jgi:hypothetical protein
MPTFAADQELDRLEAEREAWSVYAAALEDLKGREYEDAEDLAWRSLQQRLAGIRR